MSRPIIVATAALALTLATPAMAGSFAKPASQVAIRYADLNLASSADAAILAKRIHAAAVAVCGPIDYPAGMGFSQFLKAREDNATCVARTEAGARARFAALQNNRTRIATAGH